jgi:hypothetical protein
VQYIAANISRPIRPNINSPTSTTLSKRVQLSQSIKQKRVLTDTLVLQLDLRNYVARPGHDTCDGHQAQDSWYNTQLTQRIGQTENTKTDLRFQDQNGSAKTSDL